MRIVPCDWPVASSLALPASVGVLRAAAPSDNGSPTLVEIVRAATARFRNIDNAFADGYVVNGGPASGPEQGAMGVHFAKFSLFDAVLDVNNPEVLVYEPRQGGMHLVAAEYVAPAAAWNAAHPEATPLLKGHLLHFTNGPNRYGPDALLRAARVGLEAESERPVRGLESAGLVRGTRRGPLAVPAWPWTG